VPHRQGGAALLDDRLEPGQDVAVDRGDTVGPVGSGVADVAVDHQETLHDVPAPIDCSTGSSA